MISVIIVDDELWVCQLIKRIVNWEELKFNIIADANDGNEAFELIKNRKPDLVITDIRMPGLDGISLMRRTRELALETNFIIISGYNDFEYAKDAVKYGAQGYLLKPIDKKELTDSLTKVREGIFKSRESLSKGKNAKVKLTHSLTQLKEQFFLRFLSSSSTKLETLNIEKLNQEYEITLKEGKFQVVIFKIDSKNEERIDRSIEKLILEKIQEIVLSELKCNCYDIVSIIEKSQVICILNFSICKDFVIENSIKIVFNKIRGTIQMLDYSVLTVGIGSCETDINFLSKSFNASSNSIKARIILGVDKVINTSKNTYKSMEMKELFPIEKEMKIASYMELFDIKALEALLTEVFGSFVGRKEVNPSLIFQVAYEIIEIFFKVIRRKDIDFEAEYTTKSKVYGEVDECKSLDHIIKYFVKLFEGVRDFYNNSKQSQVRKDVEKVKAYISDHYMEDISLNHVANLVFLNATYLSELFKKETGINFSDYIINYRIDIAKELLKDHKYRTNEVAGLVGYRDAKYFSKLFRRTVGVNPAEYKKMFI